MNNILAINFDILPKYYVFYIILNSYAVLPEPELMVYTKLCGLGSTFPLQSEFAVFFPPQAHQPLSFLLNSNPEPHSVLETTS